MDTSIASPAGYFPDMGLLFPSNIVSKIVEDLMKFRRSAARMAWRINW